MAQHDYVLDNASGAVFRADLNDMAGAIVSINSGATAPTTTYAYMLWVDTSGTPVIKQRNSTNTGWITKGNVADAFGDVSSNTSTSVDGEISLFSGTGGKTIKRATTTGLLKASSGVLAQAVAGTDYLTPTGDGSGLTSLNASNIASGTVATARLGSGSASASTYLRGDQTWAAVSTGAMEFVSSTAASGASTVDFTGLASGYDYFISIDNYSASADQTLCVRFGTGGTPTYQTTGYVWVSTQTVVPSDSVSAFTSNNATLTSMLAVTNNISVQGQIKVYVPNVGGTFKHTVLAESVGLYAASSQYRAYVGGGYRDTSEALTALRFLTHAGATMSGTFTLWRIKRSA